MDSEELMKIGRRIQVSRHLFNYKQHINVRKITPPGRMVGNPPLDDGPTSGVTIDYSTMVKEYLDEVGIDEDGKPYDYVLKELDIRI